MAYNIDCTKASVPEALELLADAVLNPKFQAWEVAEQVGAWRQQGRFPRHCCGRALEGLGALQPVAWLQDAGALPRGALCACR